MLQKKRTIILESTNHRKDENLTDSALQDGIGAAFVDLSRGVGTTIYLKTSSQFFQ